MDATVLITGASSGIGEAAARHFQAHGWNVVATMRTPEKGQELAALEGVSVLRLDVNDPVSIDEAVTATLDRFGRLDVLVNNAGYALVGPFEAMDDEQIRRQFETNVFGLMRVTRAVLPILREQRSGTIVNVASIGGRLAFPLYSPYHGTKWAVEGFSESLQYELEPFGIRVRIVEPGPIRTDFYDRSMEVVGTDGFGVYDAFVEQAMSTMNAYGPQGRPPEDVAEVIWHAATSSSRRMRYPVGTKGLLVLRRLLPDRLFMALMRRIVLHG